MFRNLLPGTQQPYFLESGEGPRYLLGPLLATTIGRRLDTGSLMEGFVLMGAKGFGVPLHQHRSSHEALYVLEGSATLRLGDKEFALEGGDYVSVPPGTAHGFASTSHRTRLLTLTFGGNGAGMYEALGQPTDAVTYSTHAEPPDWRKPLPGSDVEFLEESPAVTPGMKRSVAPVGALPYVIPAGEGERMMAGDTLFTFLTDSRQSGGKFLALMTDGPKGQRIPNHMHEKHTETFFCLNGGVSMTAGDEHVCLRPGDFLHVPARTPHTFQLTGNSTRFIQFHAPGLNEPFFRYMCAPCADYTFLQPPPPFRFDRVMQHLGELDVKFLAKHPPKSRQTITNPMNRSLSGNHITAPAPALIMPDLGLVASIFTSDQARAIRIATQLKTGIVHINDQTINHEVFGPIGGMGASGNGARSGGPSIMDEFSQWQWITVNDKVPAYPF